MKKTLVQANDLDKVIELFQYIYYHPDCKKQEIADYFDIKPRQVDYYTSACKYLDLLNNDLTLTDFARDILENYSTEVTDRVYQRIIDDEIMGKVYQWILDNPDESPKSFSCELTKEYYPGLSNSVYERRSDNIVKWCIKVNNYLKNK